MYSLSYFELQELFLALPSLVRKHGEEACYHILDVQLRTLSASRQSLSPVEDEHEAKRFRESLSLAYESTLCRYIYDKPRGYAGDYITQEMIWLGRTLGGDYRYSGTTETGRIINSLALDMDNCRANEERIYRLRDLLAGAGPRVASIGCGCGIEFWDMPDANSRGRDILLVDNDAEALAHAHKNLTSCTHWNVTYQKDNVLKFALRDAYDYPQVPTRC